MKLIPSLGINIKDYNPDDILKGKLWRITEKIDGVRRLFYKDQNGKVRAYSRSGKADHWLGHITLYLEDDRFPSNIVYDTELVDQLLYKCIEEGGSEDSYILRTQTMAKASQEFPDNKKDLSAVCFDMFYPDGDLAKGAERDYLLKKTFEGISMDAPIFPVPYYGVMYGNDKKNLEYLMKLVTFRNGEGIMLMNMDAPYIPGRSSELIKVKKLQEFIGEVIDIRMGLDKTKIQGGIASLICKVTGCTLPVSVGVGFTNDERLYLAKYPPIGAIIEIEAFGRTKNKNGDTSLSMPIFKQIYEEK